MHSDSDININRRQFLQLSGGIFISFSFQKILSNPLLSVPEDQLSSWIHVGENGFVTVFTGKAEVGQNIRTSLAQIVAEELNISISKIIMVMGDTDVTPYDRGTFGSRSIPYMGPPLRKAAATARDILVEMAADQWKTDKNNLYVDDGSVKDRSNSRTIQIGMLTKGETFTKPVDETVAVKKIEDWKIAGTSVPKVNGNLFVTGKHMYTSDMSVDGMLYGKVLRAPAYGAKLATADLTKAKQIIGAIVVKDGDFIGVAAPTRKVVEQALKAIDTQWKFTPQPSHDEIFEYIKKNSRKGDADVQGDATDVFAQSSIKIDQS